MAPNAVLVLAAIRDSGPLTFEQISETTGLALSAVEDAVGQLLATKLVRADTSDAELGFISS